MQANITQVRRQDLAELREFMSRVIAESVTKDVAVHAEMMENVCGNLNWWLANPDCCCHLKSTIEDRIAGVVLVKNFWNLCSLFVAPEFHRQGIGRALVAAASAMCRGRSEKGALWLNAAPNAVPFYERLGFAPRQTNQPLPSGFRAMQLAL